MLRRASFGLLHAPLSVLLLLIISSGVVTLAQVELQYQVYIDRTYVQAPYGQDPYNAGVAFEFTFDFGQDCSIVEGPPTLCFSTVVSDTQFSNSTTSVFGWASEHDLGKATAISVSCPMTTSSSLPSFSVSAVARFVQLDCWTDGSPCNATYNTSCDYLHSTGQVALSLSRFPPYQQILGSENSDEPNGASDAFIFLFPTAPSTPSPPPSFGASLSLAYAFHPPSIFSISKPRTIGDVITITGRGFSPSFDLSITSASGATVSYGSAEWHWNATFAFEQLTCSIPAGEGPLTVAVRPVATPDWSTRTVYYQSPQLTGVVPESASIIGGEPITLLGANFGHGSLTVRLSSTAQSSTLQVVPLVDDRAVFATPPWPVPHIVQLLVCNWVDSLNDSLSRCSPPVAFQFTECGMANNGTTCPLTQPPDECHVALCSGGACVAVAAYDGAPCGPDLPGVDMSTPCQRHVCRAGRCTAEPLANGTACDDFDSCTDGTVCINGRCGGGGLSSDGMNCTITGGNPCLLHQCVAGACLDTSLVVNVGSPCPPPTACVVDAFCDQSGACVGIPGNDGAICGTSSLPCVEMRCVAGGCAAVPANDGISCGPSSDPCLQRICQSGSCVAVPANEDELCSIDAVGSVSALSTCTASVCRSGRCTPQPLPDGTKCGDSANECTALMCRLGVCVTEEFNECGPLNNGSIGGNLTVPSPSPSPSLSPPPSVTVVPLPTGRVVRVDIPAGGSAVMQVANQNSPSDETEKICVVLQMAGVIIDNGATLECLIRNGSIPTSANDADYREIVPHLPYNVTYCPFSENTAGHVRAVRPLLPSIRFSEFPRWRPPPMSVREISLLRSGDWFVSLTSSGPHGATVDVTAAVVPDPTFLTTTGRKRVDNDAAHGTESFVGSAAFWALVVGVPGVMITGAALIVGVIAVVRRRRARREASEPHVPPVMANRVVSFGNVHHVAPKGRANSRSVINANANANANARTTVAEIEEENGCELEEVVVAIDTAEPPARGGVGQSDAAIGRGRGRPTPPPRKEIAGTLFLKRLGDHCGVSDTNTAQVRPLSPPNAGRSGARDSAPTASTAQPVGECAASKSDPHAYGSLVPPAPGAELIDNGVEMLSGSASHTGSEISSCGQASGGHSTDSSGGSAVSSSRVAGKALSMLVRSLGVDKSTAGRHFAWEIDPTEVILGDKIGQGGYGAVYRGWWRGTEVAVKQLLNPDFRTQAEKEAFLGEISLMSNLRHPNVVLFLGACLSADETPARGGQQAPPIFYITEFVDLGDLHKLLRAHSNDPKRNPLSWHTKISLAIDAARGMLYLHKRTPPLLHRDLKSLNILVTRHLTAKICDLGLGKVLPETHSFIESSRIGTINWLAPEILEGGPATKKSDVYAFGIVLYEILIEDFPYANESMASVIRRVTMGERPEVPAKPTGCKPGRWYTEYIELMTQCWAHNKADRPDFEAVLERLMAISKLVPAGL